MDDQIADLIALGKGIEESLPDNAEELLTLVHRLLCAHRSQHAAIEKLEKEFLAPFYDGYGEGVPSSVTAEWQILQQKRYRLISPCTYLLDWRMQDWQWFGPLWRSHRHASRKKWCCRLM